MVRYRRSQEVLIQTPTSVPVDFTPATEAARLMVDEHLNAGRNFLSGREAKALLSAYSIATPRRASPRHRARRRLSHKRWGFRRPQACFATARRRKRARVDPLLETPVEVKAAAERMITSVGTGEVSAGRSGFSLQRIARHPGTHEVMIRVADDPIFGPVIIFGHGGPATDIIGDRAVALPPLNTSLARNCYLARGYTGSCTDMATARQPTSTPVPDARPGLADDHRPAPDRHPGDQPSISRRQRGVCGQCSDPDSVAYGASERRLAIRPYPKELEEEFVTPSGRAVTLRPIRPEDEPAHHDFIAKCSPEDLRLRFFRLIRRLPHAEMARLTQIDYDREMAFLATAEKPDGSDQKRWAWCARSPICITTRPSARFVRSDMKGQRLGWKLMDKIIRYTRSRGTKRIVGLVLTDNRKMLDLVHRLGFESRRVPDDDLMEVELDLREPASAA